MDGELPGSDERRGIQNATSRFKRERERELTSSELLQKSSITAPNKKRGKSEEPSDSPYEERGGRERAEAFMRKQVGLMEGELKKLLEKEGFAYQSGEASLSVKDAPVAPPFPIIMVTLGFLKDVLDGLDVTGIGIIATTAISFAISLVLFVWIIGKLSGGWWKRRMVGYLWTRYVLAIVIEFIPVIKIIPATTILILMAHYRETKIVRIFNAALENMRKGGLPLA